MVDRRAFDYRDRAEAGRALAEQLAGYRDTDALVLGLARGGVPVAAQVGEALGGQLDVLVVRKVGLPWHRELAMGAVASLGGQVVTVQNGEVVALLGDDADSVFRQAAQAEEPELRRREQAYRGARPAIEVAGRTVILVDDGIATGATMLAAAQAVRAAGPRTLVVAAPIVLGDSGDGPAGEADAAVFPWVSPVLTSVGQAYRNFAQTTDDEVRTLLG